MHDEESKRKETQRCDKSPIFPDHPRRATPTKFFMLGGVLDVVIYFKFHWNRFRGFGSTKGQIPPFSYTQHYDFYNRLGLPPNL